MMFQQCSLVFQSFFLLRLGVKFEKLNVSSWGLGLNSALIPVVCFEQKQWNRSLVKHSIDNQFVSTLYPTVFFKLPVTLIYLTVLSIFFSSFSRFKS